MILDTQRPQLKPREGKMRPKCAPGRKRFEVHNDQISASEKMCLIVVFNYCLGGAWKNVFGATVVVEIQIFQHLF